MTGSEMRGVTPVRSSSLETTSVGAEAVTGQVTEVSKDTFWPIVKAAGDKVVVLDMYTQWYRLSSLPISSTFQFFARMKDQEENRSHLTVDCRI